MDYLTPREHPVPTYANPGLSKPNCRSFHLYAWWIHQGYQQPRLAPLYTTVHPSPLPYTATQIIQNIILTVQATSTHTACHIYIYSFVHTSNTQIPYNHWVNYYSHTQYPVVQILIRCSITAESATTLTRAPGWTTPTPLGADQTPWLNCKLLGSKKKNN